MAITISTNAEMVRGLFSNNSMFNSSDMLGISYTDYASIRSGSYGKLLSAYYDLNKTENTKNVHKTEDKTEDKKDKKPSSTTGTSSAVSGSSSTSNVATDKIAAIESGAEKVKATADILLEQGQKSIFNKTAVKDAQGNVKKDENNNTITDYNKDKIYSTVKDFVDQYNTMMETSANTNISSIKSTASAMKYQTMNYADELASVGITLNKKDNTLSIDEKAFKDADMDKVKDIFNGTNSFSYKVSQQAANIEKYAEHEASRANTYSDKGSYNANNNIGEILDNII